MSEREIERTSSRETSEDPHEQSLRILFGTAYPPLKLTPSLRQQVAEEFARRSSPAARHSGGWRPRRFRWGMAAAAGVAVLLAVALGRVFVRPEPHRSLAQQAPAMVEERRPERAAPAAGVGPRSPVGGYRQPIARLHRPSFGVERGDLEHLPSPFVVRPSVPTAGDLDDGDDHPGAAIQPEKPPRQDEWEEIEVRTRRVVPVRDDFVRIPFPRIASTSDRQLAAAVESYKREAAIVDPRLSREVTLQQKATALSDLCERLRGDTGIQLGAGPSVADEKVTIFCEKLPLREVMRQLSRPFGYAWLRSQLPAPGSQLPAKAGPASAGSREPADPASLGGGTAARSGAGPRAGRGEAAYRYELVQDLRSQLLEEELRNRDRYAALLALEREIDRYRLYLGLSPDEALARSKSAPLPEKRLLEALGGTGWGPLQLYARLSPQEMAALRAGQSFNFSQEPEPGEKRLPPDLARGVLQSLRGWHLVKLEEGFSNTTDPADSRGVLLTAAPEARAQVMLWMPQGELGQYELVGGSGFFSPKHLRRKTSIFTATVNPLAVGRSPAVDQPDNRRANERWARDPALRPRVTLLPRPSCRLAPAPDASSEEAGEPRVTRADVLETLHAATGLPIVADDYTRLYKPEVASARNVPLFEALNRAADAMRLRWAREGDWLQFRSASYFHDRLKEVPNRLLTRWSVTRRRQGNLLLDDLLEIAQLSDAQLDAADMAEGARACWGLVEWHLACYRMMRPHLRWLAGFTPEQRRKATSGAGLGFAEMPLAQQQQFLTFALFNADTPLTSLEEFTEARLRVDYTVPGWFQWGRTDPSSYTRWVVPLAAGLQGRRILRPLVRERTREAALQAVRRIDPEIRESLLQAMRRRDPRLENSPHVVEEDEILPTRLGLAIAFIPSGMNSRKIRVLQENSTGGYANW